MIYKTSFFLSTLVALLFGVLPLSAQKAKTGNDGVPPQGWYIGIEGGMPFGIGTLSSFGHDKTHLGWAGGLYGGYRFNPVVSAEVSAKYGQMTLTARDCCVERGYWLGADGVRYQAAVADLDSWNYRDLQSRIIIGQYGARLNVNVLGFFHRTKYSRWSASLSPHLYAVSTKASVQTTADGNDVQEAATKWHLGYGGDVQVAFHITPQWQLGIYSGATVFTGSRMDAIPESLHKSNFVWESGLRLAYHLGTK